MTEENDNPPKRVVKNTFEGKFGVSDNPADHGFGRRPEIPDPDAKETRNERREYERDRKPYGDRDARPYGERRPYGDRKPYGDRDSRPYGERRSYGDRKPYGDRDSRPYGERRSYGDRKPYGDRDSRPYGEQRSYGDRKPYGDRDARPYGERRPYGDRKPYGDRDARPYGERRPYGDRKPYGDRDARPYGERRPFNSDRPFNSEDNRPIFRQKPIATPEAPDEDQPRDEEAILALADSPDIPVSTETGSVSEDIANPPWFKRLLALTTEKGREREGRFIAEGMRVVDEMLSNHQDIMLGLYVVSEADNAALVAKAHDANINIHTLTEDQMKRLSTTVTTQGVLAVCRMASVKPDYDKARSILTLVDSVQDPGNLGAIFRTSLGFHSSGIVLGKGTVNPFNPKVVRGSSGTFLRVPFEKDMSLIDAINFLRSKGYTIIATDLHGKQSLAEIEPRKLRKVAFLVGNEGAGTDQHLIEMADETVKIPMSSDLESLNVAVAHGILSFEMAKIQKDAV